MTVVKVNIIIILQFIPINDNIKYKIQELTKSENIPLDLEL